MRKTNSLSFFSESLEKRKKVPARSKSLRARALCLTANAKKREGKKRSKSIAYLYLHAFVCFLFARVLFFFLLACVLFCARLVLTTFFLLSRFQNEGRYFSIFLLFLTKCRTKKKAREVMKERGFFSFFGGKDLFVCFAQKHTDMNQITFFVKVGGEAFNSL